MHAQHSPVAPGAWVGPAIEWTGARGLRSFNAEISTRLHMIAPQDLGCYYHLSTVVWRLYLSLQSVLWGPPKVSISDDSESEGPVNIHDDAAAKVVVLN